VSDDHVPSVGPVMAFTAKRAEVVRFYTEIAGLKGDAQGGATWLAAENAQLVVHDPDDRQTEPDVRGQRGFVVWFGIDMLPKIILVFTLVFFVIFYNTYAGIKSVERRYTDLAFVMGANEKDLFTKVILPAALPHIFLGIKLSIPYALIGAIIGEFVASSAGLGWKIQMETSLYNTTGTMAGLIVMMFIVVAMNSLLAIAERRLLRWQPASRYGVAPNQ